MDNKRKMKEQNSFANKIVTRFLRLSIAKKMLLGYLPLAVLIILISIFALSNLNRINKINNTILKRDAPLIEAADKLIDHILAQELYGRRYAILKSQAMLALFWKRSEEFDKLVEHIQTLPGIKDKSFENLLSIHTEYNKLFVQWLDHLSKYSSQRDQDYDKQVQGKQEELIQQIKDAAAEARTELNKKFLMTADIGNTAFVVTAVVCSLGILFGIGAALLITGNISGAIHHLEHATREVSEGRFDYTPGIKNQDELGKLARAFSEMTKRLKTLEEMYLDTNSLTRLPGGLAIENVLKKRLSASMPLAFCLIDMDNFKGFSDRYGYVKGSEAIQATARIVEAAVAEYGTHGDFVGHIGGDDFVVISSLNTFTKICNSIIDAFDKKIPEFYDHEDRERGYIKGKTRQGQEIDFPIMTISIAVVTNQRRRLTSPAQVGKLAAELKEYAKSIPHSIYVVDKRKEGTEQPKPNQNILPFPRKAEAGKKGER